MGSQRLKLMLGIIAALLIAALSGCNKEAPVQNLPEPAYASDIAEEILQSLNNGDYAAYTRYFDPAMKKAVPEAGFMETASLIREKIGQYQSKEFDSAYTQEIYTVVIYRASFSFSKEDAVKVRVVFLEADEGILVSGLWFNSPKLN